NMLGLLCLVSGLGCAWRLIEAFRHERGNWKGGSVIAQGAIFSMVLLLFARIDSVTSLACLVLGCSLMFAMSSPTLARKPALMHLLVALTLSIAFAVLFLNAGAELVGAIGRDTTLTGRIDLWAQLLSMNRDPLLGTGFESFWLGNRLKELWSIFWWRPNEAYNGFLEVWLNLGWVGVALLAVVIVTGYRNIVVSFRRDPQVARLQLAFFAAGLIFGLTEAAFRMMTPTWIMFILAVIAVPESVMSQVSSGQQQRQFAVGRLNW